MGEFLFGLHNKQVLRFKQALRVCNLRALYSHKAGSISLHYLRELYYKTEKKNVFKQTSSLLSKAMPTT